MRKLPLLLLLLAAGCTRTPSVGPQPLKLLQPRQPTWIEPGESVQVELQAAPGLHLRLLLPDRRSLPLVEDQGHYRATLRPERSLPLWVGGQGWRTHVGTIRVLGAIPRIARVLTDGAVYRSGPDASFDRYDPLARGVSSLVTGRRGAWLRLATGGWVADHDVRLGEGLPNPRPVLRDVKLKQFADGSAVAIFKLGHPCALQVEEQPHRLVLRMPQTAMAMGAVTYTAGVSRIREVQLFPGPQQLRVVLRLGPQGLWGYRAKWDAGVLRFRLAPPLPHHLRGLRVILDPGHGGTDTGAIGPDGTTEKWLNLRVARVVSRVLQSAGATVFMTRDSDRQVLGPNAGAAAELQARIDFGREHHGNVFISIHHNARPNLAEGRVAHGVEVYYYRPQSLDLARALAAPVAKATGEPKHEVLWRSLHVIRQTDMPAVLIEVNYISNPKIERRILLKPGYPQRVALAIRKGLSRYLARSEGKPEPADRSTRPAGTAPHAGRNR